MPGPARATASRRATGGGTGDGCDSASPRWRAAQLPTGRVTWGAREMRMCRSELEIQPIMRNDPAGLLRLGPLWRIRQQHRVRVVPMDDHLLPHIDRTERLDRAARATEAHMPHPPPCLCAQAGGDHLIIAPQGTVKEHDVSSLQAG